MKIAFVGKGGSGKSSTSWAIIKSFAEKGRNVLAVDSDHNMDLTSLFNLDFETIPLMYKTDSQFSDTVQKEKNSPWNSILSNKDLEKIQFGIFPDDIYTESIVTNISDTLKLVTVGLGDPDALYSGKCAHGLSNPLKYYLGLLEEKDSVVVIDSVAGVDMVNFGLFSGIDAMICVVEPHINSIKVYKQIKEIARKTGLPLYLIINKPKDNDFYRQLQSEEKNILGEIGIDEAIINYDFENIKKETKEQLNKIISNIETISKINNRDLLKSFHKEKARFEE